MNSKTIIGVVAAVVVVVVGFLAYQYMRVKAEAAKWSGPIKEIVEEKATKDGDVTTTHFVSIIDAPLDKVQAALWNVEHSQDMVENIRMSKLTAQEGNSKTVEMHLQALNLPLQYFTMKWTLDPAAHRLSFKTTESQLQDLEGYYQLEPSPDGTKTRVIYESKGRDKVALPFPQSVVDSANRETFVNTMRGAKKAAQQAGG